MPTLVFVAAHPDDDTFGIGGSVALHAQDPDLRLVIIHATDGEAGEIAPDVDVARENLGAWRRQEDEEAWKILGRTPDRHEWLGLPDGGLADLPPGELAGKIQQILEAEQPDVVATFGPDGITGHPDHVAVFKATTQAFNSLPSDPRRRLLHAAIPGSEMRKWNEDLVAKGKRPWDPEKPFHLRSVPDEEIDIFVDVREVVPTLVQAIRAHKSQWSYSVQNDDAPLMTTRWECWQVGAPKPRPGRVLSDIFEGL
jgi:LmbE family N-acetylglucosaminyl deacetylase